MRWFSTAVLVVVVLGDVTAKIGYFWQISDIHYDFKYSPKGDYRKHCWESREKVGAVQNHPIAAYGDYNCDSPWLLVKSAVQQMKKRHGDVEFILWTGDGLSHSLHHRNTRLQALQNVTDLLYQTFNSQFVFPVLGGSKAMESPSSRDFSDLAELWRIWLPTEAIQTFEKGGYYTIEQKANKLRIIALNTNLMTGSSYLEDSEGQFSWFESILNKSKSAHHGGPWKVYIVGSIPPGVNERLDGLTQTVYEKLQERFNTRYLTLVRDYADIIMGQFFAHLHSDTFRLVYNKDGVPVSWVFIAPSVSPKKNGPFQGNNPGLRLYKYNTNTGRILDYMQLYLDLQSVKQTGVAHWQVEYNFTSYYDISEISAMSLSDLVERFYKADSEYLARYYRANSVNMLNGKCTGSCQQTHLCAITNLDYSSFQTCMETTRASALASAVSFHHQCFRNLSFTLIFFLFQSIFVS